MSGRGRRLYMVCYDICGEDAPRRLRKVYKILRGYGEHLQYSVFRCSLTPLDFECLCGELEDVIHYRRDQVLLVPLGLESSDRSWRPTTLGVPLLDPDRVVRIV